jgi:hypothetical protein
MREHWIDKHLRYPNDVVQPTASLDLGEIGNMKTCKRQPFREAIRLLVFQLQHLQQISLSIKAMLISIAEWQKKLRSEANYEQLAPEKKNQHQSWLWKLLSLKPPRVAPE